MAMMVNMAYAADYDQNTIGWYGRQSGANSWRIYGDIVDTWYGVMRPGTSQYANADGAGPNTWNDADMLEVGNGVLTNTEEQTHFSLWALLASPLLIGCNVATISSPSLAVLSNVEIIAVDQDSMGAQGQLISQSGSVDAGFVTGAQQVLQIWAKPMSDGTTVIGLFNLSASTSNVTVSLPAVGITGPTPLRDLWNHVELGTFTGSYTATNIPSHGVVMLRTK